MIYENNDFKFFKEFKVNVDSKKNNEEVIIKLPEYFDHFYDENIKRIKEYIFCKKIDYRILGFKSSVNTKENFCKMLEEIEIYIKEIYKKYKKVYVVGINKGGIINCLLYNKLMKNSNIKFIGQFAFKVQHYSIIKYQSHYFYFFSYLLQFAS